MSNASDFDVPRFGDDGLFPDERGWWSIPITVSLWSLIFTIVYFATRNLGIEDSVTAAGYVGVLLATFSVTIFIVIPAATITIGRVVDDGLRHAPPIRAALAFGLIGLLLGAFPAVFVHMVNPDYGWLPFAQFLIPSPLAAFLGWFVTDAAGRNPKLRRIAAISTGFIVVGCLSIGILVFAGKM